jgi:hypothetical protein
MWQLERSDGSTFGSSAARFGSDCTTCTVTASSIVNQLEAARISWKAYMEDLPHPCFTGASSGLYARKHDPFAYYTPITHNRAWCSRTPSLKPLLATAISDTQRRSRGRPG